MGFLDSLNKIISPYDDEDESFEGAEESVPVFSAPEPEAPAEEQKAVRARDAFETKFAASPSRFIEGEEEEPAPAPKASPAAGLFGMLSKLNRREAEPEEEALPASGCAVAVEGDSGVLRFTPADFSQASELLGFLQQGKTVYLTLDDMDSVFATRLLDFMTGITYAVGGKVSPVSGRAYFITPRR